MKAKVNIQVGKAPSLHLFHTTVRQCMGGFLKHTTSSQLLLAVQGYIFNVKVLYTLEMVLSPLSNIPSHVGALPDQFPLA